MRERKGEGSFLGGGGSSMEQSMLLDSFQRAFFSLLPPEVWDVSSHYFGLVVGNARCSECVSEACPENVI